MKRSTAISLLLVLTGWLALPLAGAHLGACSMTCCRRRVVHSQPECHGENISADESQQVAVTGLPRTCPSGCVPHVRTGSPGLLSPSCSSIYLPLNTRKDVPYASKGAEPKLYAYGGRAPPRST